MYQEIISYLKKAVWLIMLVPILFLYEKGGFNPAVICMVTLTFCVWALSKIELSEEKLLHEEAKTCEAPPTPIPSPDPVKEPCCHSPRKSRSKKTIRLGKSRSKSPLISTSEGSNLKKKQSERLSSLKKINFHIAKLNKDLADDDSDEKITVMDLTKD